MKVLLVKPKSDMHVVLPPLGLGYLASYCKKLMPDVDLKILDCHRKMYNEEQFKQYIKEFQPDVVGITAFSMEINSAIKLASVTKELAKNAAVVIGGPHASAVPQSVLSYPVVDYAFRGEAEIGFSYFLKNFFTSERLNAPGLAYRAGGDIVLNDIELVKNLDSLPFPAYKEMEFEKYPTMYFMKNSPAASIISSRGCPYACTFCAGHKVSGRSWRARSVSNIMEEIKYLHKEYAIREVDFWDDNFSLDRKRTEEFCRVFKSWGKKIIWWCPNGLHLNTIDTDLLQTMKEGGCYAIALGIESGSERVQKDMHKNLSFEKLKEIVEYARKIGMRTQGFFIIGYPTEDEQDILKTIKLSKSLPFLRASFCLFQPIVGSDIYNHLLERKQLTQEGTNQLICDYSKPSIATEYIADLAKIKKLQSKAILSFYLRPKILFKLFCENISFSQMRELINIFKKYILNK